MRRCKWVSDLKEVRGKPRDGLEQWVSKCSPRTISISWKRVTGSEPWGGAGDSLSWPSRRFWCTRSLRTTALERDLRIEAGLGHSTETGVRSGSGHECQEDTGGSEERELQGNQSMDSFQAIVRLLLQVKWGASGGFWAQETHGLVYILKGSCGLFCWVETLHYLPQEKTP